ncbi:TIGR04222 domain-containing membrane protein [Streptomyces sp. NPDC048606]|uniref:TIGR04222 domain-containing membrane protein n=1 Tax=Streptomyces sp. NPDC048606 TaxID=3154726 RepID=UPI00344A011B
MGGAGGAGGSVSIAVAWLLLALAAALRVRGARSAGAGPLGGTPSPVAVGLLRGGPLGATRTAWVELYLAGAVEPGWRRTVRCVTSHPPAGCSEVARAQHRVLYGERHPGALRRADRVEGAVRGLRRELERAGLMVSAGRTWTVRALLIGVFGAATTGACAGAVTAAALCLALLADAAAAVLWVGSRRTWRGARLLARMRRERPGVRAPAGAGADELLLRVALFGAPALRAGLPRFTEESGLLTRPPRRAPDRGGGSGDASANCGGCGG